MNFKCMRLEFFGVTSSNQSHILTNLLTADELNLNS